MLQIMLVTVLVTLILEQRVLFQCGVFLICKIYPIPIVIKVGNDALFVVPRIEMQKCAILLYEISENYPVYEGC